MKKNLIYLAILLVLVIIAYLLVFKNNTGTISGKETNFAVAEIEEIAKIFMADKNEQKILLQRKGNNWIVNSKYKARAGAIKNLLSTIKDVRVDHPVSKAARNNVVRDLVTKAIKIEIYNKEEELMKSYYVGGPAGNYKGSYMILAGKNSIAKNPYVVHIPGFNGYLTTRYFLNEIEWKDKTIFSYKIEEMKSVSVEYTEYPVAEESFSVSVRNKDSFELHKINGDNDISHYNKQNLLRFLSYFRNIHAEAYQNENSKKDSILSTNPFCIITVTDTTGYVNEVKLYYKPINKRSKMQFDEQGNKLPHDLDRYYATVNRGKDFMLVQDFVFGKLLRAFSEFQ